MRLLRLERYVLRQTLMALGGALGIIGSLVLLIDFVEVSRSVGSDVDLPAIQVLGLTLMKSPTVIVELLPFVFLFGTLAAFVGLNRRSELVAMRAAGVSAWRFVFPAAAAALLIGVLTTTVLSPLAAWGDGLYQRTEQRLTGDVTRAEEQTLWLREGEGDRQLVIRAAGQDRARGVLTDVSFFVYTLRPGGGRDFSERIDARSATLTSGGWRLIDAVGATSGQQGRRYASLDLPTTLTADQVFDRLSDPDATPFWSIPRQIAQIEQAGFSATALRLRYQQLLATPLLFAAMSILAAAFSLRLMRLGDLARMIASAVVLGFGFFFANQFAAAMGSAEVLPPVVAAWLPPILTGLAAFTLLFYTEDG